MTSNLNYLHFKSLIQTILTVTHKQHSIRMGDLLDIVRDDKINRYFFEDFEVKNDFNIWNELMDILINQYDLEIIDDDHEDSSQVISSPSDKEQLLQMAKERGYVTYDEINEAMPEDQISSEQIEDTMATLSEMGVNIVESEDEEEYIEAKNRTTDWKNEKNDFSSNNNQSNIYYLTIHQNRDKETLLQLADQGDAKAQLEVAELYGMGVGGFEQNAEQSLLWLFKAVDQEYPPAITYLACKYNQDTYYNNSSYTKTNEQMEEGLTIEAANLGDALAQYRMGFKYLRGDYDDYADEDIIKRVTLYWFKKSAKNGYPPSSKALAEINLGEFGFSYNKDEAIYWLLKAREGYTKQAKKIHPAHFAFLKSEAEEELFLIMNRLNILKYQN